MIGYVARDKNGELYLHPELPHYEEEYVGWFSTPDCLNITGQFSEFDNISYEDEPIKVIIKLKQL